MEKKVKKEILIFLTAAIILTLLLSTGLSNIAFKKGMPLPSMDLGQGTVSMSGENINVVAPVSDFAKIILIITVIVAFIILAYKIIKRINWKDFGSGFLYIFLIIFAIFGIVFAILFFLPHSTIQISKLIFTSPEEQQLSPLGKAPNILVIFIAFILVCLLVLLIVIILRRKKQNTDTPYMIELEAMNAINEIQNGKDLKDVIIRCYHKMCIALQDEQELMREESMTVEEFEKRIEEAGAPQKSVRQLTRLFEAVRYGNWNPGQVDKKNAIKCFNNIIQYFSEIRKD